MGGGWLGSFPNPPLSEPKLFHMKYLILLVFFISSCCPKVENSLTTVTKTDTFIDTIYIDVPILIGPAESQVIDIDIKSLCDSLYSGQLQPQVRTSEVKRSDGTRQLIARAEIDSLLRLTISCKEDAYADTLDSVRVQNTLLRTQIDTMQVRTEVQKWYQDSWFYVAMVLLVLLVLALARK